METTEAQLKVVPQIRSEWQMRDLHSIQGCSADRILRGFTRSDLSVVWQDESRDVPSACLDAVSPF